MSIGFSLVVLVGILTERLFKVPGLTTGSFALLGVFTGYAIWKYEMFTLNPASAAENIISTMPDSMILTDTDGKILIVNKSLTNLLG